MNTLELTAPSCWAPYLINGDASGLDVDDKQAADAWLAFVACGAPVDCQDAGFIAYSDARLAGAISVAADCQTYTFICSEAK